MRGHGEGRGERSTLKVNVKGHGETFEMSLGLEVKKIPSLCIKETESRV